MTLERQRLIGALMAIVATASLIIAAAMTPVGNWDTWGFVMAACTLIIALLGLAAVVSKNPNLLTGRRSGQSAPKLLLLIGIIAIVIFFVLTITAGFMGGWTPISVMQMGLFGAIGIMLLGSYLAARQA